MNDSDNEGVNQSVKDLGNEDACEKTRGEDRTKNRQDETGIS